MKKLTLLLITTSLILTACGFYKHSPIKDNPVNVKDRVAKNIEEGGGVSLGGLMNRRGGNFEFTSSNPMWRASLEILDFVPFTNVSYSGGIIITDWFSGNSKVESEKRMLKITVRFLTNEIRADALKINIHEKICKKNTLNDCNVNKISSNLENEIKLAILKKAALLEKNKDRKNAEEYRKKKPVTGVLIN